MARHKATNALLRNFSNVIDCFDDLVEDKHSSDEISRAIGFRKAMDFEFVVTLLFWDSVLSTLSALTSYFWCKQIVIVSVNRSILSE